MNSFERNLIASPNLPTIPRVAQRLLGLLNRDDVGISELAEVIRTDTALAAKVIRLINSPIYGLSARICSLDDAVLYLGLKTVRSVALSFSLMSSFRTGEHTVETLNGFWRTSLMNALAARRIASELGEWDPEEAFLAGLMADCGVLLLFSQVPEYAAILERFVAGEGDLYPLEQAELETDHARLGELFLETWEFPEELVKIVGLHHDSEAALADSRTGARVRVLHAAWLCARSLTVPGFESSAAELEPRIADLLGLAPAVARSLASELPGELRETAACFEIPADQILSYDELLVRANQRLSRLAIEADESARDLAEAISAGRNAFGNLCGSPTEEEALDEDTGLLSPVAFERVLDAYHRRALQIHRPIGLLILKLDNYKTIVEVAGRDVAVEGLRRIGERLVQLTRQTDQRARLAEDQIVLLAPGCSSENLKLAAERIRLQIEDQALETRSGPILCRISIGAAVTNPRDDAVDPSTLVSFASSAVEQAEHTADRIVING